MDRIESLIAQTEEYLQAAIENRDRFKELVTRPDGTVDHQHQQRLEQLNAVVHRAKATLAKTKELRDPPKAPPIPDEVIAKAADQAAAASAPESFAHKTLRNKVIEILIATRGMSEGHTADAILSALSAPRVPEGWRSIIERLLASDGGDGRYNASDFLAARDELKAMLAASTTETSHA